MSKRLDALGRCSAGVALASARTADVPADRAERSDEQQGRWLLAHRLYWHRREAKAPWREFFRLRDLSEDELVAEKAALSVRTSLPAWEERRSRQS